MKKILSVLVSALIALVLLTPEATHSIPFFSSSKSYTTSSNKVRVELESRVTSVHNALKQTGNDFVVLANIMQQTLQHVSNDIVKLYQEVFDNELHNVRNHIDRLEKRISELEGIVRDNPDWQRV